MGPVVRAAAGLLLALLLLPLGAGVAAAHGGGLAAAGIGVRAGFSVCWAPR